MISSSESDKEEHVSDTGLEDIDKAAVKAVHSDRKEIVCPLILHGNPLTDRKSTFQAHLAQVHTTEEVSDKTADCNLFWSSLHVHVHELYKYMYWTCTMYVCILVSVVLHGTG